MHFPSVERATRNFVRLAHGRQQMEVIMSVAIAHQRIRWIRTGWRARNVVVLAFAVVLSATHMPTTASAAAPEVVKKLPLWKRAQARVGNGVQRGKRWVGNRLKTAPLVETLTLTTSHFLIGNSVAAELGEHGLAFLLGMAPRAAWKASGAIGRGLLIAGGVTVGTVGAAMLFPEAAAWVTKVASHGLLLVGEHGSAASSWAFKALRENNAPEALSSLAGNMAPTLPSTLAGLVTSFSDAKPVRFVVDKAYAPVRMLKKAPGKKKPAESL